MPHRTDRTPRLLGASLALAVAPLALAAPAQATTPERLLYEGDSWVQGVGDNYPADGLGPAHDVAARLGLAVDQDGKGGAGYANPTSYGNNLYGTRIYQHPADGYKVVILEGSTNDKAYISQDPVTGKWNTATYAGKVNSTLKAARARYSHALVVVVGPTAVNGSPDVKTRKLNEVLHRSATANHVEFVDAIAQGWFVPGDWSWASDAATGHPNQAGYSRIAERVAANVKALS